ncbi:hypothetical protein [Candidatus Flexifilum breve]|uniref:hypothetical protein n=1 Tax=Candidatus Flexifilum breve TaxID=3140694 RepID=UPI0031CCB22B
MAAYGRLDVFFPDGLFKTYLLTDPNTTIGRSNTSTIPIDDETLALSRQYHAEEQRRVHRRHGVGERHVHRRQSSRKQHRDRTQRRRRDHDR